MRWKGLRRSDNVRDVAGRRGGRGMRLPGSERGGSAAGSAWSRCSWSCTSSAAPTRCNAAQLSGGDVGRRARTQAQPLSADDETSQFVAAILGSTEDVWGEIFAASGRRYEAPELTLFDGAVQSACGFASAAVGPFYCPADRRVYLDTAFFRRPRAARRPGRFRAGVRDRPRGRPSRAEPARQRRACARRTPAEPAGSGAASRARAASRLLRRRLGASRESARSRARARRRRGGARGGGGNRRRSAAAQRGPPRDAGLVHARLLRAARRIGSASGSMRATRRPAILSAEIR